MFSHNDLCYNNIIRDDRSLRIIDYEYAGFNYRGQDLATYISESMFTYDHPSYPYYSCNPDLEMSDDVAAAFLQEYARVSDIDYQELHDEVEMCRVSAHYMGALWCASMFNPNAPEDCFDLLGYSKCRLDEYRRRKAIYDKNRSNF